MAVPDAIVRLYSSRLDQESRIEIERLYFEEKRNKSIKEFLSYHIMEAVSQSAQLMQVYVHNHK